MADVRSAHEILREAPPPFVFHGTVLSAAKAIWTAGLKVKEFEPSFGTDLLLSSDKYAALGHNPLFVYRGGALEAARQLACDGAIEHCSDERELLSRARSHWDAHDATGRIFLIATARLRPILPPNGSIQVLAERREVRGGTIKWIERHLALASNSGCDQRLAGLARDFVSERLDSNLDWTSRRGIMRIGQTDMSGFITITPEVRGWIRQVALDLARLPQRAQYPPSLLKAMTIEAVDSIADLTRAARIGCAIRRAALSMLRDCGFRVIKTDFKAPEEAHPALFWEGREMARRLEELGSVAGPPELLAPVREALALLDRLATEAAGAGDVASLIAKIEVLTARIWSAPGSRLAAA